MRPVLAAVMMAAVVGCGASSGSSTTDLPPTTVARSDVDWIADLDALDAGVRRLHPDPFWRVGEAEWNARLADARERMPTMSRRAAELLLLELTALIDGHSGIFPQELGYRSYALRLYQFSDGYFVLASSDISAIGGEIVAVNGVPIDEVAERLAPLIPHDNAQTIALLMPMYLLSAELLEGVGVVTDIAEPSFEVLRADGSSLVLNPPLADPVEGEPQLDGWSVGLPVAAAPLSARRDEIFWWTTIGDVLYFQYNQVQRSSRGTTLSSAVAEIREQLQTGDVSRVVIDVRHNPGGNNRTYAALLRFLLDPLVDQPGKLYVIIGRQTFSAATNFVTELDVQSSSVTFVGEPTGGSPNLFGDTRPLRLRSSGITVRLSEVYWELGGPGDTRPWIAPDIAVEISSTDYFAGLDPVLQAAIDD